MVSGLVRRRYLGTCGECTQWETVGDAFCRDQNVGIHTVVLDSKHLSRAAETGLHFIGDEKNSVLIENFLDLTEIILRRNNDSAFSHNWFGDECGNIAGGFK